MTSDLDFFKKLLYEASEDDPPDVDTTGPPDLPAEDNDNSISMDDPPDIGGDSFDDAPPPPDVDNDSGGFGDDNTDDEFGDAPDDGENNQGHNMKLNEKISAIMNQTLYQRFLKLLGKVSSEISQMKDNTDVLYAITTEFTDVIDRLTDLETNMRLYLKNYFINEKYEKNLLFFNECLNLLAVINKIFDESINKGIKRVDV